MWINPGESGLDYLGQPKETNGNDDDGNGYIDDYRGWDFVDEDNNPMDLDGHGTHVAGTIGAVGNNGIGVTGVNWQVNLVALRICHGNCLADDMVDALEYVVRNNITVSNNSYWGRTFNQCVKEAIENTQSIGHIFVTIAGNDGGDNDITPVYPSSYDLPNIISVAATDNNDNRGLFSTNGSSNFGLKSVDLWAPGKNIYSTYTASDYQYLNGTSMAAPHVTGVVALLWSKMTLTTWDQMIGLILNTTRDVGLGDFSVTGGVVDATAAFVDCNNNGIDDACDILCGAPGGACDTPNCGQKTDCNGNDIPDDCEPGGAEDCNMNGTGDFCDLPPTGTSGNCNQNIIPDECEPGGTEDCNGNGTVDLCDIFTGAVEDCNENFIPDSCDIASGTSLDDIEPFGVPDECKHLLVWASATGRGTGRSWDDAITSVGAALDKAEELNGEPGTGDAVLEIWVAGGSYYEAIRLVEGVSLYGGFAGWETDRSERDVSANETILSADRDNNDASLIFTDNAEFVVDASDTTDQTTFDGFTIQDARQGGSGLLGGGVLCGGCTLNIDHCHIKGNDAVEGGGMRIDGGQPQISNTIFSDNVANDLGGGAVFVRGGSPKFSNCLFTNNQSMGIMGGGAVRIQSGITSFENCTFYENTSDTATSPSGAQAIEFPSIILIVNSIIWQNGSDPIISSSSSAIITYSDIKGGFVGTGNIDVDPQFIEASNGNLRLLPNSPARDVGDNNAVTGSDPKDLDDAPRIVGGTVDMGAYEYRYIPLTTVTGEDGFTKDRYLSFNPGSGIAAIRVAWPGGTPAWVECDGTPFSGNNNGSAFELVDTIEYCNWQSPVIHVTGCQIRPGEIYTIDATEDEITFTAAINISTTPPASPRHYGDIVGSFLNGSWSAPDNLATLNDILAAVKAFNQLGNPPHPARVDITGKVPNHIVGANDILSVVLGFQVACYKPSWKCNCGTDCSSVDDPNSTCPSGSPGPALNTFVLVPSQTTINPGQTVNIDVFIDAASDLAGYEVAINMAAWGLGTLDLESMNIDENRSDFVFNGLTVTTAIDDVTGRFGVVTSDGNGTTVTGTGYLGTFTYRASLDADGLFNAVVGQGERAFLLNSTIDRISSSQGSSILIGVDVLCTDDASCDDGNPCTDDTCDPQVGCANVNNDANTCDDGNACTSTACVSGVCQATNLSAGTSCDDGLACTGTDTCDGAGVCDHSGNSCKSGEVCTECPDNNHCCASPPQMCSCPI